jgi:hypothetical protein
MAKLGEFGVVFCGGGPATIGVFVCAARIGRLEELLDQGVLVVERGRALGGGSLRHYGITSNSLAAAFLEGLDEVPAGVGFDGVRDDPATRQLRRMGGVHAPLSLVGAYLDSLGAAVCHILGRHPRCAVARGTSVREVRVADGSIAVATENGTQGTVRAGKAVIAMGGRPADGFEQAEIVPGLSLGRYADKLVHASAVFDDRIGLPGHLVEAVRRSGRVAVVGGSHSAWSVAWVMLSGPAFRTEGGALPTVTLVHRSPIRLFYLTMEQAEADRYRFDPERDVCPVSGRVNRVAGLKGDARALARRALGLAGDAVPIRLLPAGTAADREEVAAVLDAAGLVVAATGYRSRLPELAAGAGDRIELASSPAGLAVTERTELIAAGRGGTVPNVLAYGLGAGIRALGPIGGEPSNERAITSVWLYQHDVGRMALGTLLGETDADAQAGMPAPGALAIEF